MVLPSSASPPGEPSWRRTRPPDVAPSLHRHYSAFITTTSDSVPVPRIGTQVLVGRHLNGFLRIETTGSRSAIEKPGPGSRHLHAGHRLGSLQGTPQTSPDGITLHRFRCHVLVHDESPVVHLRSAF